jgi:hypothetical protein
MFSVRSVLGHHNEDQLSLRESHETDSVKWEAGSWGREQFGNPGEGGRPPLEAATKQCNEDSNWEH